jgi:hypothetical protein
MVVDMERQAARVLGPLGGSVPDDYPRSPRKPAVDKRLCCFKPERQPSCCLWPAQCHQARHHHRS